MPLDASILLGARGITTPNPLDLATHALTLGNLALGNKEAMLKLDAAQRQQATTDAVNRVLPGVMAAGWTPEAMQGAIQAEPGVAGTLLDMLDKRQKTQSDIRKTNAEVAKYTADANKTKIAPFTNMAYSLANDPNLSPEKIAAFSKAVGDAGLTNVLPVPKFQDWNNPDAARQNLKLMGSAFFDAEKQASQAETNRHNVTGEQNAAQTLAETLRYHTGELGVQRGRLAVEQQNSKLKAMEADPFGQLAAMRTQPGFGQMPAAGAAPSPGGAQPISSTTTPGRNEEVLAGLPQQMAAQVKALAEGRMQFPSGFALKSPYWQNMLSQVAQYDPSFDAVNYNARVNTRKSFTSGVDSQSMLAINQAVAHLGELSDAYAKLGNSSLPGYNIVANYLGQQTGNPKVQANFQRTQTDALAVAHELAKVFRNSGMSQQEIEEWQRQVNPNAPPASSKAVIQSAVRLMEGRLNAMAAKYSQGMGTTADPLDLLTPESRATLSRIMGPASGGTAPGGFSDFGNGFGIRPAGK